MNANDNHPYANKIARRRAFLETCAPATQEIHEPIVDPYDPEVNGHLNPAGLGNALQFSCTTHSSGQGSVAFESVSAHAKADRTGKSPYGGAEYAVVQSREADLVCEKMATLHGGVGAAIFPSGLAAITTTLHALNPREIAIPDCVYSPLLRYLNDRNQRAREPYLNLKTAGHVLLRLLDCFGVSPEIQIHRYPGDVSANDMAALLKRHPRTDVIYLEAPGSQTYNIPDINEIIKLAKSRGIRIAMDNTWASHVRFQPLQHGIDIAIQATTKHEGGYADTPSGVVIAANEKDLKSIRRASRVLGVGAVDPGMCMRLYHRVDDTAERMDRHYATALELMNWFARQDFVAEILCPARPESPGNARFHEYFGGKGNGLFTIVFKEDITEKQVNAFIDTMLLFRIFESWGGHVSGALPAHPQRELCAIPKGQMFRFHAGLEVASDLIRDLEHAKAQIFPRLGAGHQNSYLPLPP